MASEEFWRKFDKQAAALAQSRHNHTLRDGELTQTLLSSLRNSSGNDGK